MRITIILFSLLVTSWAADMAQGDFTPEEQQWLYSNWLLLDDVNWWVDGVWVRKSFPDLGTFRLLQDDTTTYEQAHEQWMLECAEAVAKAFGDFVLKYLKERGTVICGD